MTKALVSIAILIVGFMLWIAHRDMQQSFGAVSTVQNELKDSIGGLHSKFDGINAKIDLVHKKIDALKPKKYLPKKKPMPIIPK